MPCKKCENEKWKWGERGECKYDSKEACENANSKYEEMTETPSPINYDTFDEYKKAFDNYHENQELNLSKSKKLEFGLIEDANKLAQKNFNAYNTVTKKGTALDKILSSYNKLKTQIDTLDSQIESAIDEFNSTALAMNKKTQTAIKVARELGIENDAPIKNLQNNLADVDKFNKKIGDVKGLINRLAQLPNIK
tara:strand:+ start:145 stop:726 length:582 start_codon:yes stop_codon:yes gene_type:complete